MQSGEWPGGEMTGGRAAISDPDPDYRGAVRLREDPLATS